MTGMSRCSEIWGPTWAVSPSMACRPVIIRLYSSFRSPPANVEEVAQVSAPPNTRSGIKIPRSAPMARASRRTSSALGSPMVMAVISAPYRSFSLSAASSPALSSGFMIASMALLSSVPSGLNFTPPFVSGTCFIHTTTFTASPPYFKTLPDMTMRCTSEVPS